MICNLRTTRNATNGPWNASATHGKRNAANNGHATHAYGRTRDATTTNGNATDGRPGNASCWDATRRNATDGRKGNAATYGRFWSPSFNDDGPWNASARATIARTTTAGHGSRTVEPKSSGVLCPHIPQGGFVDCGQLVQVAVARINFIPLLFSVLSLVDTAEKLTNKNAQAV